jgi:S-DNA-T family DNA segregation ATPase FtsK/SpoIIIE
MIQSGKFDSLKMNIKNIANTVLQFTIKRLIEILGLATFFVGALLLAALTSYSPDDPNFIFPKNTEIKNLLGFQGSYISDLFFQSIGRISYLIPFTLILTGINIFKSKDFFLIIENIFLLFFILFLDHYYSVFFIKIPLNYILMEMVGLLEII